MAPAAHNIVNNMHSVAPMEAGNAGAAEWLDDDGRPRRTGTFWTASTHIITAVIGSGVLSLAWVAGPTAMLLFAFVTYYTATLLAKCYRTGDPEMGKRNYTYMDAVRSNLGGAKVVFCGVIQYANLVGVAIGSGVLSLAWAIAQLGWVAGPAAMVLFAFVTYYTATLLAECYRTGDPAMGKRNYTYMDAVRSNLGGVAIGYTIASSISMKAIRRAGCFHTHGHADPCKSSSTPYMILFGVVQILFSRIPDFDQIWWLSIIAAVMSFTYSSIGLSHGIAQTISHGGFKGSLTGVSIGAGVTSTQKIWHTLQAFGDIQVMQKATRLSVATTTIFYMLCGCMGYAAFGDKAPDNLLTGFGFYEPFWLLDIANIAIVLHLVGASWVTPMLSPACRTGRRARMPRTGAVKGSGRCIGRAEAVPAGRSDGTSTLTRTGDCSLLPDTCDWFRIMGSAVISTPDMSCVISAAVMCMEAQYRRFNKKYEGANSWSLKVTPKVVQSLKDMCYERRAWHPFRGAPSVEGVLDVIRSLKKGIPTCHDSISLRLKSYVSFGQLSPRKITSMLRKKGPVIGVLYAGEESYLSSTVYRGNRFALGDRHAVVCTGCRKVNGELCVMIMDNLEREGPFRFVLHEALEEFHVLTVDAS